LSFKAPPLAAGIFYYRRIVYAQVAADGQQGKAGYRWQKC
jgi:hypothetical protein